MSGITLILDSLSADFAKFVEPKFPRARAIEGGKLAYSANGSSIGDGLVFEQPHLWTFSVYCSEQDMRILGAMYHESDVRRRLLPQINTELTLIDKVREYQERSPRTRAIAPGTSEVMVGASHVSYFAQFHVWFVSEPEFDKAGDKRIAHLSFQETGKFAV
ncbi:hypothetical protein [Nostoc sp.]|uniref:hypothetical protein n=1 Tax=Nostoc sp. TaxID=1180 RepID=UPI002FF5F1CC